MTRGWRIPPTSATAVHALDSAALPIQTIDIHGYKRAFISVGHGPTLLLIHGIGDSCQTWAQLIPEFAKHYHVLAPDLLGHGASDKPRADYSVAAYANGMRDLLTALNIEKATVIGHSLGGGVAMQFAYQYPDRCERLILVASGGVAREVHPLLRAASLPGTRFVLPRLGRPRVRRIGQLLLRAMQRVDTDLGRDAAELERLFDAFPTDSASTAFARTLGAVVDMRGQLITMLDRCYLTRGMPVLLIWGARDAIIPVTHAYIAHVAMPGSRLLIFPSAAHFPHRSEPRRFLNTCFEFLETTQPSMATAEQWRALLRHGRGHLPWAIQQQTEAALAGTVLSGT